MKRILLIALLAATCGLTACSRSKKPVLKLYNWAEYVSDDLIERFEKENNCKVIVDNFDSNEAMYAKLKAGGVGYDIAVPSSYQVNKMRQEGMLLELDHSKLPNLVNIDPMAAKFSQDPEHKVSVPYLFTTSGIGYRMDKAPDVKATWKTFESPAYAGRMTLLNDVRETLGAALKALGYSLNTTNDTEVAAARDLVISWKKNTAKFESEQYRNGLVSAEFLVVHAYSSDILQAMEENDQIAYLIPKGTDVALRARGLETFRRDVAELVPEADASHIQSWDDVKLLDARLNRAQRWYIPGLLCIGDAAHAMSPVGGMGINVAVQDAVGAATLLAKPLRDGTVGTKDLAAVQRRRMPPAAVTQAIQRTLHRTLIGPILAGRDAEPPAAAVALVRRLPWLTAIPAHVIGVGVRPERAPAFARR